MVAAIGALLVLLAWPTNASATGNGGVDYGSDAGEFFALMLLAFAGVLLTSIANDLIPFFLGLELASLPTYIMVSISRPAPIAQEAGVKYFFLGALAAALLLLGFSYLYGSTGSTRFDEISDALARARLAGGPITPWQMLAIVILITGLCFKIAAVPLQVYALDVYQGAATPVTALLSFVPKTAGFVALVKLLNLLVFQAQPPLDHTIVKLLWVLAVLTMFAGNLLGLLQNNVKRVLACSSIAHSGYMLAGLTIVAGGSTLEMRNQGLEGILFYLAAYGLVNIAAFGVLILLPSRARRLAGHAAPELADSAESFDDLASQGRSHVALGLAMAVACFSLIGIPLTIGFLGKLMLIRPALDAKFYWLVVFTVVNAAISAAYYLRIVGAMFLRPDPLESHAATTDDTPAFRLPVSLAMAVVVSVAAAIGLGVIPTASDLLDIQAKAATDLGYVPHLVVADRAK